MSRPTKLEAQNILIYEHPKRARTIGGGKAINENRN
jgi:hypothetical protein